MNEIILNKDILDEEISNYNIEEITDEMVFNENLSPSEAYKQWFFEFLVYIKNKYKVENNYEIDDEYNPILWDYIVENLSDVINFEVEVWMFDE